MIDPSEVARRIVEDDGEELFVLDVRNEVEYEGWRIPGSTNVPVYEELLRYDYSTLKTQLDALPEYGEIAVVCVGGVASSRAVGFLCDRGFDAKSVAGGMSGWGRVHRQYAVSVLDGVVQIVRDGTGCVSYLVHDDDEAIVIDPSQYIDQYLTAAAERDLTIVGVADTHAHTDHVSGARQLASELDVSYYLHEEDTGELVSVTKLEAGETITVGDRALDVFHTPGHTPGSVSFRFGEGLIAGDTLLFAGVGRPALEAGNDNAIREAAGRLFDSLYRLMDLDDETIVLPGHFSDTSSRPLATALGDLKGGASNELLSYVGTDDKTAFVETIVTSSAVESPNYDRIKRINRGKTRSTSDTESLELGPYNCATT